MFVAYPKVTALEKVLPFLQKHPGNIYIQEKVDGSNVGVVKDVEGNVTYQSRTQVLDPVTDRKGIFRAFIEWAEEHRLAGTWNKLPAGFILYGETMNNNGKIKYERAHPFVLFDVAALPVTYDGLAYEDPRPWAETFENLPLVPTKLLYHGSDLEVPDANMPSAFGIDIGAEGVVVKAYNVRCTYVTKDGEEIVRTEPIVAGKVVTEKFKETEAPKKAVSTVADPLAAIAEAVVTQARFDKAYQNALENGLDVNRPHVFIGKVSKDVHDEDADMVKDLLFEAYWKPLNGAIAQRVIELAKKAPVVV